MRTLLHVGFHKTGTTTIQTDLKAARQQLAALGVHYPSQRLVGEPDMAGHHRLATRLFDDPGEGRERIGTFLSRAGEKAGPSDTLIVSSEAFNRYSLRRAPGQEARERRENYVAELCGAFGPETEIVVVLRRPDSYLLSIYQESVQKSSRTGTAREFMDSANLLLDFRFQISLYDRFFDRVHVLVFEDLVRAPSGITAAFLDALGVGGADTVIRETRANPSLHPYLTEYKRLSNYARLDKAGHAALREALRKVEASGELPFLATPCALLGRQEREDYLASLSDDLGWLARRLGKEGDVFPPLGEVPPGCPPLTMEQFEEIHKRVCRLL